MENFIYYTPTKVYFGREQEKKLGEILQGYNVKKVLLHYGKSSIKKNGLYDTVVEQLKAAKIDFVELGGVEPNPKLSLVLKGVEICKKENVDLILAVGGGSVLDSSKSISVGAKVDFSPWKFSIKEAEPKEHIPVGCILTISAAGSDMSNSCVITNDETLEKRGFVSDHNRCLFSILNPELTYSVSKYQTACGIVDIMMHTLERYFNPSLKVEFADEIAIGLLKSVKKAGEIVVEDLTNYEARRALMLAGAFSHNGLTGIGKKTPMPVHQLEHALSGCYDFVAHGAGLAVLFPKWCMLYYKSDVKKFSYFAREVMDIKEEDECKAAYFGIVAIQSFFKKIGMPISFRELGIEKPNINKLLEVLFDKREHIESLGGKIDRKEAEKIYLYCLEEDF